MLYLIHQFFNQLNNNLSFLNSQFKYQVTVDGTVAAYRLPYLLAGNSLVLKQDSHYYEHFYKQLKPMVHYVPFHRNLSDLVTQVEWAIHHDETAQQITRNARNFVNDNLMPDKVLCYYVRLLKVSVILSLVVEYLKQITKISNDMVGQHLTILLNK